MSVLDSIQALVRNAGVFLLPLVLLAFATFALAIRSGLGVREITFSASHPERVARDVARWLRLLAAAASASPLVGLLGTVHGLITLFSGLEEAGSFDRDILSRGVGQALFTTEFGLAIAVPGIVLHALIGRSLRARSGATAARKGATP
jgi:biopolymer transport protein ExbB/TolQ